MDFADSNMENAWRETPFMDVWYLGGRSMPPEEPSHVARESAVGFAWESTAPTRPSTISPNPHRYNPECSVKKNAPILFNKNFFGFKTTSESKNLIHQSRLDNWLKRISSKQAPRGANCRCRTFPTHCPHDQPPRNLRSLSAPTDICVGHKKN